LVKKGGDFVEKLFFDSIPLGILWRARGEGQKKILKRGRKQKKKKTEGEGGKIQKSYTPPCWDQQQNHNKDTTGGRREKHKKKNK